MAPRLGHLLYWTASWIAVIVIAAGIVVWLYFAQPNKDPLGLVSAIASASRKSFFCPLE
jgi:hypothetical protein